MYISRMHHTSTKRPRGPRVHIHTGPPDRSKHPQCIPRRVLERGVAVHGADAEECQAGMVSREEDGEGVLLEKRGGGQNCI